MYESKKNYTTYLLKLKNEALDYSKSLDYMKHNDVNKSIHWDKNWNIRGKSYFLHNNYKNNKRISYYAWFLKNINNKYPDPIKIYTNALFAVRKEYILYHPIEYYKKLILEVNHHIEPIEGHFMERSWYYIFN